MRITEIKFELRKLIDKEKAQFYPRFFKSGKGEYGEGDKFLGVTVPNCRKVARASKGISLTRVSTLLKSKWHEERLVALLILVEKMKIGPETHQEITRFYLSHTCYINNWDLVDLSCYKIVGEFYKERSHRVLLDLSKSANLWEKRIAMVSTLAFIREKDFKTSLKIAKNLLNDDHDLIHKAVGWMLREIGKRDLKVEVEFLTKHYKKMPRTMLRYAIERFEEKLRLKFLHGKV